MIKFTKNFDDGTSSVVGYPLTKAELRVLLDENYVLTPKEAINMFLDMGARMARLGQGRPDSEHDFDGIEIPFVVPPEGHLLNSHYYTETTPLNALYIMRGIRRGLVDSRRKHGAFTSRELESIIATHLAKE